MSPSRTRSAQASRYEELASIAAGGMATVFVGTVRGSLGFRQLVAIKKPHAFVLDDEAYRRALLAEARLASMVHHANVVNVRDVEADETGIRIIMDYVEGASLAELIESASEQGLEIPAGVVTRIIVDACAGLHAAHELCDEDGKPLHLVHRDVSPQNLLVGVDGVARVTDFGVAKFERTKGSSTTGGAIKGKFAYMAPEYVLAQELDRRADVFGMAAVLWEALAHQRLFRGQHDADTLQRVLTYDPPAISSVAPSLGTAFDALLAKGLARSRDARFPTAAAFGSAIEACARAAGFAPTHGDVGNLVEAVAGARLKERRALVRSKQALAREEPGARDSFRETAGPDAARVEDASPSVHALRPTARSASTPPDVGGDGATAATRMQGTWLRPRAWVSWAGILLGAIVAGGMVAVALSAAGWGPETKRAPSPAGDPASTPMPPPAARGPTSEPRSAPVAVAGESASTAPPNAPAAAGDNAVVREAGPGASEIPKRLPPARAPVDRRPAPAAAAVAPSSAATVDPHAPPPNPYAP